MTLRPLSAPQERLWRAITHLITVLPRAIDDDLVARTGVSLSRYLVLSRLSEAPDQQLRMSDLAEQAALSPSRITRLVQALEAEGLVTRRPGPDDQRVGIATLTAAGRALLEQTWPEHLAGVRTLAMNHVRRTEIAQLTEVIERLNVALENHR